MESLGPALQIGGTLLKSAALFKSGQAASQEGAAIQRAREFEAAQLEQRAGQERATAQRKMLGEKKRERLVQSALQARSAASGGAGDISTIDLASDIAAEGAYRAQTALFEGESAARGLENVAAGKRYEGAEARRAGQIKRSARRQAGFINLLGDGKSLSLFSKFGEPTDSLDTSSDFYLGM